MLLRGQRNDGTFMDELGDSGWSPNSIIREVGVATPSNCHRRICGSSTQTSRLTSTFSTRYHTLTKVSHYDERRSVRRCTVSSDPLDLAPCPSTTTIRERPCRLPICPIPCCSTQESHENSQSTDLSTVIYSAVYLPSMSPKMSPQ